MAYVLKLQKVNKENFSSFGVYVEGPEGIPAYSDHLFDWWNNTAEAEIGGDVSFGFVQTKPRPEITQQIFEQHRDTSETLLPLDNDIILIVGRNQAFDGIPQKEDFQAFLVPRGTAVILNKGVWHYAPATLKDSAAVMVIFKKGTSENDKIVKDLETYHQLIKVE